MFGDLGHELVALAVHRPDDPLLTAAVTDRLPDGLDPRRERSLADERSAPDLVEQLDLGDHPLTVLDQVTQDVEDLRLDMDAVAARSDLDAVRIDLDVAEGVDHRSQSCRSTRTSAAIVSNGIAGQVASGPVESFSVSNDEFSEPLGVDCLVGVDQLVEAPPPMLNDRLPFDVVPAVRAHIELGGFFTMNSLSSRLFRATPL